MYDYLIDHAYKNVWCAPKQDTQMIVKPARLTGFGGAWNRVEILHHRLMLPVQGPHFHIYQIGQLHPALMGFFPISNKWMTMADACSRECLIVDIYADTGVQMPRSEVWYIVTKEKNLLIAVKEQTRVPIDFNRDALYVRVYSNAYFNSPEANVENDGIEVKGGTLKTTEEILALQLKYLAAKAKPGGVMAYVNGRYVRDISLITVKPGDVAEYVHDSSIYEDAVLPVNSLPTFNSELDTKYKYLLHRSTQSPRGIDYFDDVDLFVVKGATDALFEGVLYHRNLEDAVRMLTHKDYAIPTTYLASLAARQNWGEIDNLYVHMHLRKAGWNRPLVNEHHRIRELYKLPDEDIISAMTGIDAVMPEWTAASLEQSFYTSLMRAGATAITREMVQEAYGYNAVSKLLADTPSFTRQASGQTVVDVPYGLLTDSTVYEYDSDGLLLDWHLHTTGGSVYACRNPYANRVEIIGAQAGPLLDETYGEREVVIDPNADYRMYTCPILAGLPTNEWVDVTDSSLYSIVGNVLTWHTDPETTYTLVRSNRTILAYQLMLGLQRGVLRFSLTHQQYRNNVLSNWIMQVPMGELDIFLNGHSLIEDLEYFVDFPEIVITNKSYLINPEKDLQRIDIRFSGFCKADFSREKLEDRGFIDHGLLSDNNRFDVRDDKVLRMVVSGRLYDRSELKFAEDDAGVEVPNALNGAPYLIRDIVVPMRGGTLDHTYTMRSKAMVVDEHVADYMSTKVPNPTHGSPNTIEVLYPLVSPFCSKIIADLQTGILNDPRLIQHYSDADVFDMCKPYEELLAFDPTQDGKRPDERYTIVHPHPLNVPVGLNLYHYRFLSRVVKLYLKDRVNLSHFVQITA